MSGYRYKGPGTHFTVQAKDYTKDEFDKLSPMAKRIVRHSPAWEAVTSKPASNTKTASNTGKGDGDTKGGE